jgi:hypothetical protein
MSDFRLDDKGQIGADRRGPAHWQLIGAEALQQVHSAQGLMVPQKIFYIWFPIAVSSP